MAEEQSSCCDGDGEVSEGHLSGGPGGAAVRQSLVLMGVTDQDSGEV